MAATAVTVMTTVGPTGIGTEIIAIVATAIATVIASGTIRPMGMVATVPIIVTRRTTRTTTITTGPITGMGIVSTVTVSTAVGTGDKSNLLNQYKRPGATRPFLFLMMRFYCGFADLASREARGLKN